MQTTIMKILTRQHLKIFVIETRGEGNLSKVSIKELADFSSAVTLDERSHDIDDIHSNTELDERSKQVIISCAI